MGKHAFQKHFYFPAKKLPDTTKWELLRNIARRDLTLKAQLKLEWIIFYYTFGGERTGQTAKHFGITRKTLHKWLTRFNEKNLLTLEEKSRAPFKKRGWEVDFQEEANIIALRKKNMEYGKKKLKVLYKREYGRVISTWRIERVVRKHKLYPDRKKHDALVEKRQKSKPKVRINEARDVISRIQRFGFLWHIDAIIIWWYGQRRIIFTALEEYSKIAFARVYSTNKSAYAQDFLKRIMYLSEGKVEIIHSDNGSEFEGEFKIACKKLNIARVYSRVRTPTDNPALEKFNDTIQREWLALSEIGLDDIDEANKDLTTWLVKYNDYRPHEALDYLTPLEYAQQNFFETSPMWSASSPTCKMREL